MQHAQRAAPVRVGEQVVERGQAAIEHLAHGLPTEELVRLDVGVRTEDARECGAQLVARDVAEAPGTDLREARVARADAMFAATVTLSLGALARLWLQPDERPDYVQAFLFWTGLGIGILLKGPIGPVAIGLTVTVLVIERGGGRWLGRLVPIWGAIWAALLVLPWIVALLVSAAAPPFPARASGATLLLQYSFNIPPGSHILAFGATFWPSALFAALAIPFVLDNARQRSVFFCLAWALPGWALAELIPGKLPHFILGACPAIAFKRVAIASLMSTRRRGR